jgi:hypothetical protein
MVGRTQRTQIKSKISGNVELIGARIARPLEGRVELGYSLILVFLKPDEEH